MAKINLAFFSSMCNVKRDIFQIPGGQSDDGTTIFAVGTLAQELSRYCGRVLSGLDTITDYATAGQSICSEFNELTRDIMVCN